MKKSHWKIVLTAVTILVFSGCLGSMGDGPTAGQPAPGFSLTTADNQSAVLADQKGKVVLLDFWATWCGPCRMSLPHVQKLSNDADRAAKGLVVWAVNNMEDGPTVAKFLADNKYSFTVPMDSAGATMKAYGVQGIPTTVIVGRDGNVRSVFVGYGEGLGERVDAEVDKALAEPPG